MVGIESGEQWTSCVDRTPLLTFMLAVIKVGGCAPGPRPPGIRYIQMGNWSALADDFRTLLATPGGPESIFQQFTA